MNAYLTLKDIAASVEAQAESNDDTPGTYLNYAFTLSLL